MNYRRRIYDRYFSASYGVANAPDDAAYRANARVLLQILAPHLPADRGARVLDAACGIGYAVHALREAGWRNVEGVDVSPEQVAIAQQRGLPVSEGDVLATLEGAKSRWDAIVALDFIEHLTKDEVLRFLDAAREALVPGGRLILKTPNANSLIAARGRWRDLTHELLFTEQSMNEAFLTCGLEPVWIGGERWRPFTPAAWVRLAFASLGRALWKAYLVAELGREGAQIPVEFNLVAVARRP